MRTPPFPLIAAITTSLGLAAQPKPPAGSCEVPDDAPLAMVTGPKNAVLWNSPTMKFTVPAGHPVSIGKRENDWTCASHYGSGYGWILTNRLHPIQPDLRPPSNAWTGTWMPLGLRKQPRGAITQLVISTGTEQGNLKVEGQAYWFGAVVNGERVTHDGAVGAEAKPNENHLHIVDGGCEIGLALIGGFLQAKDNRECGGMNVTFTGVWQKTK